MLTFAASLFLFQLANAAMLPIVGAALVYDGERAGAAVLAAHEAAWDARWTASDVLIEGDDESQRAVRFAVYHLTSTANPEEIASRSGQAP